MKHTAPKSTSGLRTPVPKRAKVTKEIADDKTSSPGAGTPSPRCQQGRRTEDEAAARVIKLKLLDNGYDPDLVRSARNSNGETIHDLVAQEIALTRGKQKYLKTEVWVRIHSEFYLNQTVFKALPEVPYDHDFEP